MREFWIATRRMRYPIVGKRCAGSRGWDIDGNEYIDFGLGFGVYLFGYNPDFIVEAMHRRIDAGMPMGFQSDVSRDVSERIARMTGMERVTYCNTGAEAVMVALRLARAVTGRNKIVVFAGSYHGSSDATIPGLGFVLGVTPGAIQDTIVLPYGDDASLQRIAELGDQLAAVLVEPVQGRQLWLQPAAFLKELRRITAEQGTALIFDEVMLGFRIHQGVARRTSASGPTSRPTARSSAAACRSAWSPGAPGSWTRSTAARGTMPTAPYPMSRRSGTPAPSPRIR